MKAYRMLMALALVLAAPSAAHARCDCTEYPFTPDPPCFQKCAGQLVSRASPDALRAILRLRSSTVDRIRSVNFSTTPALSSYEDHMTKDEYRAMERRLRSLSQDDFQALRR